MPLKLRKALRSACILQYGKFNNTIKWRERKIEKAYFLFFPTEKAKEVERDTIEKSVNFAKVFVLCLSGRILEV